MLCDLDTQGFCFLIVTIKVRLVLASHYYSLNVYLKYGFLDPTPGDHVSVGMRCGPTIVVLLAVYWIHWGAFKTGDALGPISRDSDSVSLGRR